MDKILLAMTVLVVIIVGLVGICVGITVKDTLEQHPEITEIGAPPRLEYVAAIVLVAAIILGIVLKTRPVGDKDKEKRV